MGQYLGKIGPALVGNIDGRFLGRRMYKDTLAVTAAVTNFVPQGAGQQSPKSMAAWSALVYDLRFGSSSKAGSIDPNFGIKGWTRVSPQLGNGTPSGLDAVAYQSNANSNRVVVTVEGSTTTGDWLRNILTTTTQPPIQYTAQMDAAYQYGRQLALQNPGKTFDLTGQSLGAGLAPIVAAGIEAAGGIVSSVTVFSSPEWGSETAAFLQSKGMTSAQITSLRQKTEDYTLQGDAIRTPGTGNVFAASRRSPGQVLFEDISAISGTFGPVLVRDGIRTHSAGLMAAILDLLPSGFVADGPGQTFVIDRHGRVSGFKVGEQAPAGKDLSVQIGVLRAEGVGLFTSAILPNDSRIEQIRTNADGTLFADFELPRQQGRVRLTYAVGADGKFVVLEERFEPKGKYSRQVLREGADGKPQLVSDADAKVTLQALKLNSFEFAGLFGAMGASLGNFIGGENALAKVTTSAVVSTIALNIGQALDFNPNVRGAKLVQTQTDGWFDNVGVELANAFRGAAIGSASSFLSMQLGEKLGLKGFGAELFNVASSSVLGRVLENVHQFQLENIFHGITPAKAFGNVAQVGESVSWDPGFFSSAVGSFLGAKLGSLVVQVQTQAAAVLSSVGSAAGSYIFGVGAASSGSIGTFAAGLASNLGKLGNFIVPGIGAFIGFVLGALIGNLFGRRKPRVPTANAIVELQAPNALYTLGSVTQANGGNIDLARSMGEAARDTLNGLIAQVTRGDERAKVSNNGVLPNQAYGHTGGDLWVQYDANLDGAIHAAINDGTNGGERFRVSSADEAVERGVLWAIPRTEIIGGDLYLKRALFNLGSSDPTRPKAPNLAALAGDLQIAEDYAFYLQNRAIIDAAIAEPYTSMKLATVDFLAYVRADAARLDAYKAAYPTGSASADPDAKNLAQIRAWGQTQWDALTPAQRNTFLQQNPSWNIAASIDSTFYDNNKAFMTRAMAKDSVPLTGADLSLYYANYIQVDRIISRIAVTQFAAAWIITLQRAAELKLDKTAASDVNGGAGGLYESLRMMGLIENVAPDGSNAGTLPADMPAGHVDILFRMTPGEPGESASLSAIRDFNRNGVLDAAEPIIYEGRDFYVAANYGTPSTWDAGGALTTFRYDGVQRTFNRSVTNALVGMHEALDFTAPGWGPTNFWITDWHTDASGLVFSGGNDIYLTGAGRDYLDGGFGNDWLDGGAGDDTITGSVGNDVILGRAGNDSLFGDDGDDAIYEGEGGAVGGSLVQMFGGDGNDTMDGGAGHEHMWGEAGDDVFIVDPDDNLTWDYHMGGAGRDTLSYERHSSGRTLNVFQRPDGYWEARVGGVILHYYDFINDVENIRGGQGNDNFTLWGSDNRLEGLAGDDTLNGDGGADTLEGGAGKDVLDGGDGYDRITYRSSKSAVWIDLTAPNAEFLGGDAEGDTAANFEEIEGSKHNDTIIDNSGSRHLFGLEGDDWLAPNEGFALVDGGVGFDTIDYSKATTSLVMDMSVGGTAGYAGAGHTLQSVEGIVGTDFGDYISGNAADNVMNGGKGNDTLIGQAGADTYVIGRNEGVDTIIDNNQASNGLVFGDDVLWGDLTIDTPALASGPLLGVYVRGETGGAAVLANFGTPGNNLMKSIDLAGAGALDVTAISYALRGEDEAESIVGRANQSDLIFAQKGNDTIWGAPDGVVETSGNVIVASFGDDQVITSTGDDQFAYERGHGVDTITDAGGRDTIVFGPTVVAEDVIYKIVGDDLWIGVRDLANLNLEADQVVDRIRLVGGGVQYTNIWSGISWINTIEHIVAGGVAIEITKLDIPWTQVGLTDGGPYAPLVFDLAGDGLDLISVNSSSVIFKADNVETGASLYRIGWVSASDGILALDRNKDGVIDRMNEISFVGDLVGAKTDLEGLVSFDTNKDGVLDAKDAMFGEFRIWRDVNQNGVGGGKELATLADIGITSIDLKPMPTGFEYEGNESVAVNTASFKWADGRSGTAHDVLLALKEAGLDADTRYSKKRADFVAPSADGQFGTVQNVQFGPDTVLKGASGAQSFRKSNAGQDGQDAPDPIMRKTVSLHDIAIADEKARRGETKAMPAIRVLAVGLDGAALKKKSLTDTSALRDIDGDGIAEKISWVGAGAGILIRDRNKDGIIDPLSDFVLSDGAAVSDKLNGLAALDSNADGVLDEKDRDFASLQIWRDQDGDAISRKSELSSLSAAGIAAIELKANGNGNRPEQSNAPVTVRMTSGAKLTLESYDLTARSLIEFARDEANKPNQMRDKPTRDRANTSKPITVNAPGVAGMALPLDDEAPVKAERLGEPGPTQQLMSEQSEKGPDGAAQGAISQTSGGDGYPGNSAAGPTGLLEPSIFGGGREWWNQYVGQQTPTAADWLNPTAPGGLDPLGFAAGANGPADENDTISADRSRFIQALAAFGGDAGADAAQNGGQRVDPVDTIGLPSAWTRTARHLQRVDG